jgi:hypothetical protein
MKLHIVGSYNGNRQSTLRKQNAKAPSIVLDELYERVTSLLIPTL